MEDHDGQAGGDPGELDRLAAARRAATGSTPPAAVVHHEEEPAGTAGSNDSQANAEPITGFGTGRRENQRVRILGALASLAAPRVRALPPTAEDNGSISLSKPTGIDGTGAITTTGVPGDGPHGTTGDQTNDFDSYTVTASAGNALVVDTSGATVDTDTIVAVYTAAGDLVAADDDSGTGFRSRLSYDVAADGTYFVLVAGTPATVRSRPTRTTRAAARAGPRWVRTPWPSAPGRWTTTTTPLSSPLATSSAPPRPVRPTA